MRSVAVTQGTSEWHDFRRQGIGASDAPVIEGNSPYKTPRQLYYEKCGMLEEDVDGKEFIFAKGHDVESTIRKHFFDLTGVEMKAVCAIHPKFDHIRASLDGYSPKLGVLEAKYVGQETIRRARNNEIPPHHYTQIQHQLCVTGSDVGQWFGHDGKNDGVLVEVRADKEYIFRLLEKEHVFWSLVTTKTPPLLSENDFLIPEDQALLYELRNAKEFAENAALYYDALKKRVVETYNHPKIAGAGLKLFQVKRQGPVRYSEIPEVQALSQSYVNNFRSGESLSWSVTFDKPKKVG